MNHPTHFDNVTLFREAQPLEALVSSQPNNSMIDELQAFGEAMQVDDRMFMKQRFELAQQVGQTLYRMRQKAGLIFPGDEII